MMTERYYVFIGLALVSEIIGTVSGFGSSILFVPIASLFFDFKEVLGITAVFHVFSNLSKIALFRKGIDKDIVLKLGIPAIIFVSIGAILTTYIQTIYIEVVMNFLILFLAIFLIFNFAKPLERTNKNLYIGGIVSGFLAGIAGTGGAIRGITLSAFSLSKDIFIATSAMIDLGVDVARSVIYVSNGYFKKEYLFLIPFLIGVSIFGSFIGKKILLLTSEIVFRYIVLAVIIITSLFQLTKFLGFFKIWG